MDGLDHSDAQSPETETSNMLPIQEHLLGHEEGNSADGQNPDTLDGYNSGTDENYVPSSATSSTDEEVQDVGEHTIMEEISDELRVLQGENYTMSRLEVVETSLKYHHEEFTKLWGAMQAQNTELLGVCKELLQELKKGTASSSTEGPPAKVSTGRGKAKVPTECSVSCQGSNRNKLIPYLFLHVSRYLMLTWSILFTQSTVRQVHNTLLLKADNGYSDWQLDARYGIKYV